MLELARLGVATARVPARALDACSPARRARTASIFFEIEPVPVSSSEIRERVARGEPIDGLVPPGRGGRDRRARPVPRLDWPAFHDSEI